MQIIADTHTHTAASSHAYSTVFENVQYAAGLGMRYLCWTDHAPSMPGGPHPWFFGNLKAVPEVLSGVRVLKGVEADIVSPEGELDLSDDVLSRLEWVNVSIHAPLLSPDSASDYTAAYLAAVRNPYVDVICHSGSPLYPYDYEQVVREIRDRGKLLEINEHSFEARPDNIPNCRRLAELCGRYGCRIVVSSDAHFLTQIGQYGETLAMLEEIGFPEELVLNADAGRMEGYLQERRQRLTGPR